MTIQDTGPEKIANAQRNAKIMTMRAEGATFQAIAAEVGISRQRVHQIVAEMIAEIPAASTEQYRTEMLERLDRIKSEAAKLAFAESRVTYDEDGSERADHGPKLAALREMRSAEAQIAKLLGLDAPVKSEVAASVAFTYQFQGAEDV